MTPSNRLSIRAAALLLAGAVAAGPAPQDPETPGSDWPGFRGIAGDGVSPETSVFLRWPEGGPPVRWSVAIGEGYSMASVAGGRVYHFDRHADLARLTCRDARNGEQLWRSEYPTDYKDMYGFSNGPRSSPVVDGERVYVFGVEGRLRCHAVGDGKLLWEVDTAAEFGVVQNFFGVGSTPVVEGDLLIVPVGGSPPGSPGIQSGRVRGAGSGIVAFDKRTGKVRYKITDELASYSSPIVRTIGERRRGFHFARGGLVAFEPRTGKVDFVFPWRAKKLESVNAATPVVVKDTVFLTESYGPGGALLRVKPGGYELLRKDAPRKGALRSHWATPVHHDGYLYGCTGSGSSDAELVAVAHRTGEPAWSEPKLGRSTLVYVDGHFIVLTEYGELLVIEATPEAFRPVARVRLELLAHPAWSPPALSRGLLYVRGKDRLVCLDLKRPE